METSSREIRYLYDGTRLGGDRQSSNVLERSFQAYLLVLLRYKLIIFLTALIVIGITVLYTRSLPRLYTATAMVSIGSYIPPIDGPMAEFLRAETDKYTYLTNQLALLGSHKIAKKVLSDNILIRKYVKGDYEPGADNSTTEPLTKDGDVSSFTPDVSILQSYLGLVSDEQLKNTTMVRISGTAKWPMMAARIANAHSQAFTQLVREQRVASAKVNVEFLERRFEETKADVIDSERRLKEFVKNNNIAVASTKGDDGNYGFQVYSVVDHLGQAVLGRATAEAEIRELRSTGVLGKILHDPGLRNEYLQTLKLRGDQKILKKRFQNHEHPLLKNIEKEIDVLETGIQLSARQRVRDAEVQYKAHAEREALLRNQLEEVKAEDLQRSRALVQYELLRAEYESADLAHREVGRRYEEALVNARSEQKTVQLVDPAVSPVYPTSPNRMYNIMLGCFFGPILGIALAFLLDFFNNTVESAGYLEKIFNLSVLGTIPKFESRRTRHDKRYKSPGPSKDVDPSSPTSVEQDLLTSGNNSGETLIVEKNSLIVATDPFSVESEAFRHLRTIVSHSLAAGAKPQILLVTSGQKEDGKTTVATNLAVSLAQISEKTLLIDGDLRLPSVHEYFDRDRNDPGLADYLGGKAGLNDVITETGIENLCLLTAGNCGSFAAELFTAANIEQLFQELTGMGRFDRVIIDSPPVARVADALLLSRFVSGVALVVRSGKTSKPAAEMVISRLRQVDAPILGAVLNGVRRSTPYGGDYYYYYYPAKS